MILLFAISKSGFAEVYSTSHSSVPMTSGASSLLSNRSSVLFVFDSFKILWKRLTFIVCWF